MSEVFSVEVIISRETRDLLLQYFRHVRFPAVEDTYCGFERHHKDFLRLVDKLILDHLETKMGYRIKEKRGTDGRIIIPQEANQYVSSQSLILVLLSIVFFLIRFLPTNTLNLIRLMGPKVSSVYKPISDARLSDPTYDCDHPWEVFNDDVHYLSLPEWTLSGKFLHIFPAGMLGNRSAIVTRPGKELKYVMNCRTD